MATRSNKRQPAASGGKTSAAPATSGTDPNPAKAASTPESGTDEQVLIVPEPKCAQAKVQKGRPHPSLLQVIKAKGKHPGKGARIRRWDRYEVGMSVLHCRMEEGLDHLDVLGYYVKHNGTDGRPLMTLRPMSDEERKAALARWDGEAAEAQTAAAAS